VSTVGEACVDSNSCVGAETANELPPQCGSAFGAQPTCGAESTFCYALDGSFNGASPICVSGQCREGACTSLNPAGPGEACPSGLSYECEGRAYCSGLVCTDVGLSCSANDNSATGVTDECFAGECLNRAPSMLPRSDPHSFLDRLLPSRIVCWLPDEQSGRSMLVRLRPRRRRDVLGNSSLLFGTSGRAYHLRRGFGLLLYPGRAVHGILPDLRFR
jgi:hypothetical protein